MRTDAITVKSIIPTALEDSEINTIIRHANLMVTRALSGAGLTDALLKDIETWMAAHLIAIGKERQPMSEKVGDIWITYNKNPQGFLSQTTYGQSVLFLDTSGLLQKGEMKKASIAAINQVDTD